MNRTPLPNGHIIQMDNGAQYEIKHIIGEGGFSLIYSAYTVGGTSSVVIKEFYPSEGAYRNSNGKVLPISGNEDTFQRNLDRFENEGVIGGYVSQASFQTIPFLQYCNGYAVMKQESHDMQSLSALVDIWCETRPIPFTGNIQDRDPVFPDLVRVRYSLRITESILTVLGAMHSKEYLHLDISGSNVLWAGQEISTGENCEAFLADFGCSVKMNCGEYHPEYQLSYSPGFAAPEVQQKSKNISPATDLYSVGILLFYLCVGRNAIEITHNRKRQIQRELSYLEIPDRIRVDLQKILQHATEDYCDRYQSAEAMLTDIRKLRNAIPIHPLNRDNTRAFTLYSLKSMLNGSMDTHYSWADELQDRRGIHLVSVPESIYSGISWKEFKSDDHFLQMVLPNEIYSWLNEKINSSADKERTLSRILSCSYDSTWKDSICRMLKKYGTRSILEISRTLLNNESIFFVHQRILFQILDNDGERLKECYYNCNCDIRKKPYVGLAMFILFALLGPDGFKILLPSPTKAGDLFFTL